MNTQQRQIKRSLASIGVKQLPNFINDQAAQQCGVSAVRFLKEALERRQDLEAELLGSTEPPQDRDGDGYHLKVTARGPKRFAIELVYRAGPVAGDGEKSVDSSSADTIPEPSLSYRSCRPPR